MAPAGLAPGGSLTFDTPTPDGLSPVPWVVRVEWPTIDVGAAPYLAMLFLLLGNVVMVRA